jgi:hypothetical protein
VNDEETNGKQAGTGRPAATAAGGARQESRHPGGISDGRGWLKDPAFAGELARLRNAVMDEALGSVKSLTTRAAEELHRLLGTDNERLRRLVCKDILSYSIRVREVEGLERRLACLEEKINQQMKGKLR